MVEGLGVDRAKGVEVGLLPWVFRLGVVVGCHPPVVVVLRPPLRLR